MKWSYLFLISTAALTGCGGVATQMATPSDPKSVQGLTVTSPADNSTVAPKVHYAATATTSCAQGIASMGVYTAPNVLAYSVNGDHMDTTISLSTGTHATTVQAWDQCGKSTSVPITVNVSTSSGSGSGSTPAPSPGKTFANIQQGKGWAGYALLPPKYLICPTCKASGPEMTWSMTQGISSPSVSGNATQFTIGGQTSFGDVLWNNHLIGDFSSQGLKDPNQKLNTTLHNFTYDVYFYLKDVSVSQAIEFDINQFVNGQSYIWGHECRIAGGHEWDIWDNQGTKWHPTGVACKPKSNAWNHLVIQVQRTSDDRLLFKSVTLNGNTATLNSYYAPTSTGWSGLTVNYQQDLNVNRDPYSVWLDKLNFVYW